jgi:hypothetical protein
MNMDTLSDINPPSEEGAREVKDVTITDSPIRPVALPESFLKRLLLGWHQNMSPETECEFVFAIRRLAGISPIPRWALFAGSGVASAFFRTLSEVWRQVVVF